MFLHIGEIIRSAYHEHVWTEWEKERLHYWTHAECILRYCRLCGEKEYKLLSLQCPQLKIKGEYCNWCKDYAKEWERRLEKIEISCDDDGMARNAKHGRKPELKRNLEITLRHHLWPKENTYALLGKKYRKNPKTVWEIVKQTEPFLNLEKIKEVMGEKA